MGEGPGVRGRYRPPALLLGSIGLHAAGALALAAAPRHWRTVAGLFVANHVVLAAASLWPKSRLVGENLLRLPESAESRGEVALTFDDGPGASSDAIIAILSEIVDHNRRGGWRKLGGGSR